MAPGIEKPCGFHGCPNTTLGRFCPDHTKQAAQQYERDRANDPIRKLYHTQRWRLTRLEILARDPICVECHHAATEEIDHVVPARAYSGDFYDPENLQGLCKSCHSAKTAIEGGFAGNNAHE